MGDSAGDKYEYKAVAIPPPNGTARHFFTGTPRLVPNSLTVYVNEVPKAPSGVPDYDAGTFALAEAPGLDDTLQCSFSYLWFTDAELSEFLLQAAQSLSFDDVADDNMPAGVRPVILQLASYYAYMRKATEYADALVASAAGYTADQSKAHPNWRALADQAMKASKELLDLWNDNPLNGKNKPVLRFTEAFRFAGYQPRS